MIAETRNGRRLPFSTCSIACLVVMGSSFVSASTDALASRRSIPTVVTQDNDPDGASVRRAQ
jgi:hypothetical protein